MTANDDMREDFRKLETKLDALRRQVDGLPTKDNLIAFKDEIISNFRVLAEDAKESAKKAAEGYAATLGRIERDLGSLNRKVDEGLFDHTRILADHNRRLVRLEGKRPR